MSYLQTDTTFPTAQSKTGVEGLRQFYFQASMQLLLKFLSREMIAKGTSRSSCCCNAIDPQLSLIVEMCCQGLQHSDPEWIATFMPGSPASSCYAAARFTCLKNSSSSWYAHRLWVLGAAAKCPMSAHFSTICMAPFRLSHCGQDRAYQ